jgi:hypothetical protein
MKSLRFVLPILLLFFFAERASAQLSIIIFSEKGEKFTAFINGSPQNDKPASRVEGSRPGGPSFKVRIVFDDNSLPEISKSIFNSPGAEYYYVIRKTEKGKYVLDKTSSEYVHNNDNAAPAKESSAKKEEKTTHADAKAESKSSGSGGNGCSNPMEEANFIASREMISNAPFDGPKLSHAKSLAEKNCLTTSQIIDVIYVFSGESSRLSFAKFAYRHCYDPKNYDRVKDVLRRSSQDELQRYIDSEK